MGALQTVRWRPLLDELAASLPDAGDTLVWCLNRSKFLPPLATTLAVLAVVGGKPRLSRLVYEHTTEPGRERAVAEWIYWTSRVALRTVEAPEPAVVVGPVEGLWRDPRLGPLPLMHLALEWAESSASPLVVRWAELGPVTGGRCMRETTLKVILPLSLGGGVDEAKVTLIEISPTSANTDATWLHEFSHVLDPDWAANPCDTEPFADRLGELLAAHRPANLAQVAPLIERVREELARNGESIQHEPQQRCQLAKDTTPSDVDLPKPGIESLVALANLPLEPK